MKTDFHKNGFTLIEALVAIAILLLSIVAPIQIAQRGIAMTSYAKNELIAQYLAQDAADYILDVRAVSESTWKDTLQDCIAENSTTKHCLIDTINTTDAPVTCTSPCDAAQLRYDPAMGYYSYASPSGFEQTKFKRVIAIVDCSLAGQCETQSDEAKIGVAVSWGSSLYPSNNGLNDATNINLSTDSTNPSIKGNSYVLRFSLYKQ